MSEVKKVAEPQDLEIKDALLIFSAVWSDLEENYDLKDLAFPHEIIWLGGAPGAGKGTNTPFVMKSRGITAPPIVISGLLNTPQAQKLIDAGKMVGDREVITLLFDKLLEPEHRDGVVVDGFPRTKVQVECLKMFYHKLLDLHRRMQGTAHVFKFRKPLFRIVLLFVSEEVSVDRQLGRGKKILEHNRHVRESGNGEVLEERATDIDPELCRNRYRTFKETTFDALQSLRKIFHFYFVDAEDDIRIVEGNIKKEFAYQSSLELSRETFQMIRNIPLPEELAMHARQELVERLEEYNEQDEQLFQHVVEVLETKIIPIVRNHAISGHARINTEDELFDNAMAIRMALDVLSERGYHAMVDVHKNDIPDRVDPKTNRIICKQKRVYRFDVRFLASDIRRGP